jgi:hypothetical protein
LSGPALRADEIIPEEPGAEEPMDVIQQDRVSSNERMKDSQVVAQAFKPVTSYPEPSAEEQPAKKLEKGKSKV